MTSPVKAPLNPMLTLDGHAIRCEFALPIPDMAATAEDAGIPEIEAEVIEELGQMPEVVKLRQAREKAQAIESQIQECREQMGELTKRQTSAQDINEKLALNADIRAAQVQLETLQRDADFIAPIACGLATKANQFVRDVCHDKLADRRSDMEQAANAAKQRASERLALLAAQMEALADSPEAAAAIDAAVDARRAAAARRTLNAATAYIIEVVLADLELL